MMNVSTRGRRWILAAAICLLLFTVTGFFVLPPIVKAQAVKRLSAELGRTVTLGKVRMNPYALSMTLEDFDIREKDGQRSFVGWQRLYVNFDALSSLTGDWVVSDVELDGFHAAVAINADGTFNFADVLAKLSPPNSAAAAPTKPSRAVRVVNLKVGQARVDFSDRSRKTPFASTIGPMTFVLTEFRTAGARGAPYHFAAVTEAGEKLAWSGTLAADPMASKGEFEVANLILKKYTPYIEDLVQADLTDGKLGVRGHYELSLDSKQHVLKLTDGEVHLRDLKISERANQQSAVELSSVDVSGIQADAIAMKASVGSVAMNGGKVSIRRETDGSINLLTMMKPSSSPTLSVATPTSATPPKSPEILIGEVTVKDLKADVVDNAAPRPATLGLTAIQLSVKNVTLADGAVMPLELSFGWAPAGTVHVAGTVLLKPDISADLKADVADLEILPVSPYVEQFVNARITQGTVATSSTVHIALPVSGPLSATLAGDVTVKKFGMVDGAHSDELAGFGELKLSGLKLTTAPQLTVSLAEISVSAPYARVVVNADKTINLLAVVKSGAAPAVPAPNTTPAPSPKIEIGRVVLADGDFSFTDRSVEPNVHMTITQFGGTISGLSSENLARGDVDLKGSVDGAGPVAISGKLDPLGPSKFVDLKVEFKNVDLLPISPYTGKFAGYELARGKLVVDARVLVDGKKLDATNVVTLHQFSFGAATNSPDATGLPVRLGVALLKDSDGKIVIDLPVQGSLDDPNFRIGKVVMRVLVNLLTKVATSPFSLLGSMFGGGGDELAFQEFPAGSSELQPAEVAKLGTMVKALINRPGLSLGIEGGFDTAADTYALKQQKLEELVRRQIWEARHAVDPNIAPPADLVIKPEERAAMVKKLFDEKFPPGTQFGAPLAAPPPVTAAPSAPKPGVFKRVINAITFRGAVNATPAKAEATAAKPSADAAAAPAGPSLEEMSGRLAETITVDENDLRALAAARAQRVRDYFITTGKIAADRLFLSQGQAAKQDKGPRVFLSLQ